MAIGGGFEKEHQYHFLVFRLSDRKSTRLNSSHLVISYAVFCLKKKILEQAYEFRPIRIRDRAAIITKSTILNDVAHGTFVSANSAVTTPTPPHSLAVGRPSRVL